jgi:hypothetical protein
MTKANNFPVELQAACNASVASFKQSHELFPELDKIKEWLEVDGWDNLLADYGENTAIKIGGLAQYEFNDDELLANLDLPSDYKLTDLDRIKWGRQCINDLFDGGDESFLCEVLCYELKAINGDTAVIGCLLENQGQGGPVCDWQGLFNTKEEFLNSLAQEWGFWITPLMGDVTDEVILSYWQKNA